MKKLTFDDTAILNRLAALYNSNSSKMQDDSDKERHKASKALKLSLSIYEDCFRELYGELPF